MKEESENSSHASGIITRRYIPSKSSTVLRQRYYYSRLFLIMLMFLRGTTTTCFVSKVRNAASIHIKHRTILSSSLKPTKLWRNHAPSPIALFSTKGDNNQKKNAPPNKKIKINPNWEKEYDAEALSQAFDEMAKKEGFDDVYYADDDTFEDDFDFGDEGGGNDMEERIAAAKRDMDLGRVSSSHISEEESARAELQSLGYQHETDPRTAAEYSLASDPTRCPACGAKFQCTHEDRSGFLPQSKYEVQMKWKELEDMQNLIEKAESREWSADDEIEYLQRSMDQTESLEVEPLDLNIKAEQLGLDLSNPPKKVICKRCHGLQNFGKVESKLRPGYTTDPLLSQENFQNLLSPIRTKQSVVITLVDIFDFSGSILPQLDKIVGPDNPVIFAANKADLLLSSKQGVGLHRLENWVRRELEYLGIQCLANIGGAVRLVSCKTGFGIAGLLDKAMGLAERRDCDVYVIGAANAGKSTLMNYILGKSSLPEEGARKKSRAGAMKKGAITTSPLPGTTLEFIKVELTNGRCLYDTPGLLVPGTLTHLLTPEELKLVVPKKEVEPISFRIAPNKCVLVGGLAQIQVLSDSKPFLFTFYVSNDIKLHLTDAQKIPDILNQHIGDFITPPLLNEEHPTPRERMDAMGEFTSHDLQIDCDKGWKEASADIALRGLGWVSVTGAGTAHIRVSVPKGIGVSVRPPLMPFDVWQAAAKYTGGRAVRKSGRSKGSGKRRSGVGRR